MRPTLGQLCDASVPVGGGRPAFAALALLEVPVLVSYQRAKFLDAAEVEVKRFEGLRAEVFAKHCPGENALRVDDPRYPALVRDLEEARAIVTDLEITPIAISDLGKGAVSPAQLHCLRFLLAEEAPKP